MIKEVSAQELEQIIDTGSFLLVDFSATWCGPCHRQHDILEELNTQMNGDLTIVSIDIDKNREFATQSKIKAVPTIQFYKDKQLIVFTDKDTKKLDRLVGVHSLHALQLIAKNILKQVCLKKKE
jgi:thioredoxin 1